MALLQVMCGFKGKDGVEMLMAVFDSRDVLFSCFHSTYVTAVILAKGQIKESVYVALPIESFTEKLKAAQAEDNLISLGFNN